MRLCSISLALLALGACSPLVATASDGWTIEREDMFQEEQKLIGKVQRSRITFTNGVQFLLPLERAQSLAVLRGMSGTAFLAARGANCTYCDENTSIHFYRLEKPNPTPLEGSYPHPGTFMHYMDGSFVEEWRLFFGRCLSKDSDVAIWIHRTPGHKGTFIFSNAVLTFGSADATLAKDVPNISVENLLNPSSRLQCTELPGFKGTTEP